MDFSTSAMLTFESLSGAVRTLSAGLAGGAVDETELVVTFIVDFPGPSWPSRCGNSPVLVLALFLSLTLLKLQGLLSDIVRSVSTVARASIFYYISARTNPSGRPKLKL